jgi:hypothetical protein
MRKASTLVGLTLIALAATARAQESVPAAAPPAAAELPAPSPRRAQLGLSFMPMAVGKFISSTAAMTSTQDASFAFGVGVSASYVVWAGLSVGVAPQAIFNVQPKEGSIGAAKQYDLMARVAYTVSVVDTIAVYAEVLPGYSFILPPAGERAQGPVVAFGAGGSMDLSDRTFLNLGVGYQIGYQKLPAVDANADARTKYVRVVLGGGVRF